jgi:hypothetical protein
MNFTKENEKNDKHDFAIIPMGQAKDVSPFEIKVQAMNNH